MLPSQLTGLVLLHLSDLHFGNKNRFQHLDLAEFGRLFSQAVQMELSELNWQPTVDLVVVSGDIAELGKPKEFEQGRAFLTAMIQGLQLAPSRTVFVPGNHDLNWPECKAVEALRENEEWDETEYQERLNAVKFRYYNEFLVKFYGNGVDQLLGRVPLDAKCGAYLCDFNLDGRRISLAALNTSERETHRVHGGELGKVQAEALMKAWTSPEYNDYVKVAVVHHNPMATPPENIRWTEDYFKAQIEAKKLDVTPDWLAHYTSDMAGFKHAERLKHIVHDANAHLILHGHHHNPTSPDVWLRKAGGVTPILSVGSFGLNADQIPTDQPLTCQLILFQITPQPRLLAVPLQFDPNYRLPETLDRGQFQLDLKSESKYNAPLPPPPDWTPASSEAPPSLPVEGPASELVKFVDYYRKHLVALHSSYDLKNLGVLPGDVQKTVDPKLDDLYLPLRFAAEFDIDKTNRGRVLDVNALLGLLTANNTADPTVKAPSNKRKTKKSLLSERSPGECRRDCSLAITGSAGAGKTTWMRYTFRRMRNDARTLPFLIELRAVAKFWHEQGVMRRPRSIEVYLEHWLTEYAPDYKDSGVRLRDLLGASANWLPVLLVDGWDELGDLGTDFRAKLLGLMEQFPRLLVIASSRPYGTARPGGSDGFMQLQLQPLNSNEIGRFAQNFYRKCYGDEEVLANRQAKTFRNALARSEDATLMAKTPLLLTMMLFVNRSKRLPDKRHQLYEECLLSLLSERPAMQMEEGAQLLAGQWCPAVTGKARLQIVARMAHDLQTRHSQKTPASGAATPIVVSKETLKQYLPLDWEPRQREGFLLWLCGRAGVMVDNTEDNIWFAHLSFQEFLTAWHLKNNLVGPEAVTRFQELAAQPLWWETLLLWVALLNDESQERATPLLQSVLDEKHLLLAGMMLADGVGDQAQMATWSAEFANLLQKEWPEQVERCLRAWQASRQEQRREQLFSSLVTVTEEAIWVVWLRLTQALERIGYTAPVIVQHPESAQQAPIAVLMQQPGDRHLVSARQFAGARAFSGVSAIWPGYPEGLLELWPSQRCHLSLNLQRLASLNQHRDQIKSYLIECQTDRGSDRYSRGISVADNSTAALKQALILTHNLDRALERDINRALTLDLTQAHDLDLVRNLTHAFERDINRALTLDLALARVHDINLVRDLRKTRALGHNRAFADERALVKTRDLDLVRELIRELIRDNLDSELKLFILSSYLAYTTILRSLLGCFRFEDFDSLLPAALPICIMAGAARASIFAGNSIEELKATIPQLERRGLDPFWIAFARHIARISTAEDRALLEDLAAYPEKREPPLSWGLQYIVRGDVLLPDGTEITLDELCAEAGVAPYQLLEEMPPEIEPEEEQQEQEHGAGA
jgi:3',5'-cyclic AMP phosphodiesterase CpdA